jgi:hypothetical protein
MKESEKMKQNLASTASSLLKQATGGGGERGSERLVDQDLVQQVIDSWSTVPREAAERTIHRYGTPNEGTPSRLIWYDNGPWLRTIVYRDEVPHNFPKPHTDVLEQFVSYRVPLEKFDDIAAFDGSVIPERTKGEVSARCDMEEMNILALNLMHDIVTGERNVEDARNFYAEAAMAFMKNEPSSYTASLRFDTRTQDAADPDETNMTPMMKKMVE